MIISITFPIFVFFELGNLRIESLGKKCFVFVSPGGLYSWILWVRCDPKLPPSMSNVYMKCMFIRLTQNIPQTCNFQPSQSVWEQYKKKNF